LTAHGVHIEKTHDLSRLIKLCVGYKDGFAQFYDIADELSPYAVTTCYPDDRRICTQNEASEAVEKADKIKNFILSELQKLNIDKNG
jgi:HEPN domain-containing protein